MEQELLNIVIVEETLNFKVVEFPTPLGYICNHALFITDVVPTSSIHGVVGFKEFEPDTVPPNIDLVSAYTDTSFVTIKFLAEGGVTSYSPTVTVHGILCTNLEEVSGDRRIFRGSVSIEINDDVTVVATSSTGGRDTVTLYMAEAAPVPTQITVTYPGTQTSLKNGDIVQVRVKTPNESVSVDLSSDAILNYFLQASANDSAGLGFKYFNGTLEVNDITGSYGITATSRNLMGSVSRTFTTPDLLLMDQVFPTINPVYVNYPFGQRALKNLEWATITSSVTDFDSVEYSSDHLTILNSSAYELQKTVRSNYVLPYGVVNYTIHARRLSNGSESILVSPVSLCDELPICTVHIDAVRLKYDNSYEVLFQLDKPVEDSSFYIGVSVGLLSTPVKVSSSLYRSYIVMPVENETDSVKFINFSSIGTSGLVGHQIVNDTYSVGGFSTKNIVFRPFSHIEGIGIHITNIYNVSAFYLGGSELTLRHNTDYYFNGFTIVDQSGNYSPNGNYVFLTDTELCNSNTTGTLTISIVED